MVAVLGIDDQLPLGQEFVGDPDRLIQITACIAAQVEDQPRHPLVPQPAECLHELGMGGAGELRELHVADPGAIRKAASMLFIGITSRVTVTSTSSAMPCRCKARRTCVPRGRAAA